MKSIAVVCKYRLEPDRIGGMDYFFWEFDDACKQAGISIIWFFPNSGSHGNYANMHIVEAGEYSCEDSFLQYVSQSSSSFDTVICHFLEICTAFYREVKERTAARMIVVDHNPRPIGGYSLRKRLRKRIKGMLYGKYIDIFVAVSEYTRRELIRDFGNTISKRIRVIYNGIDVEQVNVRKERNTFNPTFLVACHLRESKGIQDLISAVNQLPTSIRANIRIDTYGDGPFRSELEKQVMDSALSNQFRFLGSSNRLFDVYHHYDYLIHPSHMECFSLGLLESLAANVPVITTSVGGNEEAITDGLNGYIFEAKNIPQLKVIIENVYTGKQRITENTRQKISDYFTISRMVDQHINLTGCI